MTSFNSIVYKARPVRHCRTIASAGSHRLIPIRFSSTRVGAIKYSLRSFKFSQISLVARSWRRRLVKYAVIAPSTHPSRAFKESRFKLVARVSDYSLADSFGVNAQQDKDTLTIKKSDFTQFGLPDNSNWKVSDLICALLFQAEDKFREDRRIRIRFYRNIHIIEGDKAYDKKSYIIIFYSIATQENFPSPRSFLI